MKNTKQDKIRIAIQGGHGSFHEIACREYFDNKKLEIIPCDNFPDVCTACNDDKIDFGIMAIENTVSGSLVSNYSLLREYNLNINGEVYLRIEQNLLALPGQRIEDISEIHSHYMAIAQTRVFFRQYPDIKLIESNDTALSAWEISTKNLYGVGAIASSYAAELYSLEIVRKGIETNKKNFTRFLILDNKSQSGITEDNCEKASLVFMLPHTKGSLSQVLSILSFYELNLTKIQSLPVVGKEWEYLFYIDVVFDNYKRYKQAINAITPLTSELNILGEYKKGRRKISVNKDKVEQLNNLQL